MTIVVTMQSYVSKRTPKNIRGMIFAVIGVMSAIGSIIYLQVYSLLLNKYPQASWMAFGVISLIDIITLVLLTMAICCGKFGDAAAGQDEAEVEELRGPDGGKGGYSDIPELLEDTQVWNNPIEEADEAEENEPTTSKFTKSILKNF